jgi:hypothetical protein
MFPFRFPLWVFSESGTAASDCLTAGALAFAVFAAGDDVSYDSPPPQPKQAETATTHKAVSDFLITIEPP